MKGCRFHSPFHGIQRNGSAHIFYQYGSLSLKRCASIHKETNRKGPWQNGSLQVLETSSSEQSFHSFVKQIIFKRFLRQKLMYSKLAFLYSWWWTWTSNLLLLPPECWNYGSIILHSVYVVQGIEPQDSLCQTDTRQLSCVSNSIYIESHYFRKTSTVHKER